MEWRGANRVRAAAGTGHHFYKERRERVRITYCPAISKPTMYPARPRVCDAGARTHTHTRIRAHTHTQVNWIFMHVLLPMQYKHLCVF